MLFQYSKLMEPCPAVASVQGIYYPNIVLLLFRSPSRLLIVGMIYSFSQVMAAFQGYRNGWTNERSAT